MSTTTAPAPAAPAKMAKKKTAASKPKKVADHPKYAEMVKDALTSVKERGGSSRLAILKYIMKKYNLGQDEKLVNAHLKMALRAGIKNGSLKQAKGTGATGSFRIGEKTKPAKKAKTTGAKKPKVAKKPKAVSSGAKPKKVKKTAAAAGEGKAKKPKVAKKAKSPAKAAKPTIAKKPKAAKAAKPKAPKTQKAAVAKPKNAAAKK